MRKITKEQVEMIEGLVTADQPNLDWCNKWYLLLTKLGLKPASEFGFLERLDDVDPSSIRNRQRIESVVADIKKVCEALEIPYFYQRRSKVKTSKNGDYTFHDFCVGSSEENLAKIVKYVMKSDEMIEDDLDYQYHYNLGIGFGYPETAVAAWTKAILDPRYEEIPPLAWDFRERVERGEIDISGLEEAYNNAGFVPSVENYREELKVVQGWLDATREVSPKIYQELIENKK